MTRSWLAREWREGLPLALAVALGLAGCAQPTGPVFGDWQGQPPGSSVDTPVAVDLVLDGGPGATSGRYHITTTTQNPNQFSNNGTQQWGGPWTSTQRMVNGEMTTFITLNDHLASQVGSYALEADGKLHALDPNGTIDASPRGALYTLSPVRPRGVY